MILILPTKDLVLSHSGKEELFSFHEDGIKGIIKDVVLGINNNEELVSKIIANYSNSVDGRAQLFCDIEKGYVCNTKELLVEECVKDIVEVVEKMIYNLFCGDNIVETFLFYRWLGMDLMINVVNQREQYARREQRREVCSKARYPGTRYRITCF